ncbi:penicillin-binding protein 2, partial [Candidatus Babeliales bacterium]|nr:penicillin-binding protein 2 [Candidatus Babeliales bacterium]
ESLVFDPAKHFAWIKRNLSSNQLEKIKRCKCQDIHYLEEAHRFYPLDAACSCIGNVDIDGIGIEGIEKTKNETLSGLAGIVHLRRDARSKNNRYFSRKIITAGKPGDNVRVTIDVPLQLMVHNEVQKTINKLDAQGGAAIVMDPYNGHIHALVSINSTTNDDSEKNSKSANKNIPVSDCYELGSVIKPFTALAALEEKVTTTDELIDCQGEGALVKGFPVTNWKPLGVLPFSQVVGRSSNVGIAKVACRLGHKLYDHLKLLGFGEKTGIELPGERLGFINPPQKWSLGSLQVLSFGYEMNATLIQLARAMGVVATGGKSVTPTLLFEKDTEKLMCHPRLDLGSSSTLQEKSSLKSSNHCERKMPLDSGSKAGMTKEKHLTESSFDHEKPKQLYSQHNIELIKEILENADKRYGLCWSVGKLPGIRVMGKTGTARCIKDGEYSENDHVYTFAGIIEDGCYSRVIITFIKQPKRSDLWASQITAPLFQRIAIKTFKRDMVTKNKMTYHT